MNSSRKKRKRLEMRMRARSKEMFAMCLWLQRLVARRENSLLTFERSQYANLTVHILHFSWSGYRDAYAEVTESSTQRSSLKSHSFASLNQRMEM